MKYDPSIDYKSVINSVTEGDGLITTYIRVYTTEGEEVGEVRVTSEHATSHDVMQRFEAHIIAIAEANKKGVPVELNHESTDN